jgi:hypothetical protein
MSYLINAPVTFENTADGQVLDFNAGPTATNNVVRNFVATDLGDLLYRGNVGTNQIAALPIGTTGQVLLSNGSVPYWGTNQAARNGFSARKANNTAIVFTTTYTAITDWDAASNGGFNTGNFVQATGVYTCNATAIFAIDIYIQYGITGGNSDNQSVIFYDITNTNDLLSSTNVQSSASWGAQQVLHIHQTLELTSGVSYDCRIRTSGTNGTKTVTDLVTRFNITQVSV